MNNKELKSSVLLLLASIIWGFAFIAQRVGIKYVGSFTFNGIRFALGAVSLIPLLLFTNHRAKKVNSKNSRDKGIKLYEEIRAGVIIGSMLFGGITLQQLGLVETTAGKPHLLPGFILFLSPFLAFLQTKIKQKHMGSRRCFVCRPLSYKHNQGFFHCKGDLLVFLALFSGPDTYC